MKILKKKAVDAGSFSTDNQHIEAVLWDMDGTLIDSEPLHEEALLSTLTAQGIDPPDDLNSEVIGLSTVRIYELLTGKFGLKQGYGEWCDFRQKKYLEKAANLRSRQGALNLYKELRELGYKQGIVSNSDRIIVTANMQALGLTQPDQVSVSKNDVREGKPSPEGYLRAAWLLGVNPSKALVIEDSVTGSLAGIAAGMMTAYLPESNAFKCPSKAKEFKDFEDLRQYLMATAVLQKSN